MEQFPLAADGLSSPTRPQPLLTLIIPTLNEAAALPALLEDLNQQQDCTFEVLIGDGGSTDATRSVAELYGAQFISAGRGRAAQMNAAAALARGNYYLFLHADSRIEDPFLLSNALRALQLATADYAEVAGHFRLRFLRSARGNTLAYRYIEEKTACNRTNTTNGDQGLLLSKKFFRHLGGFDDSLPFLEDQRLAEKIRSQGTWITLPGVLTTSARRFESEGFHRRYLLMAMMMGLYSIGELSFFVRAPGVYRVQEETGHLVLSPFFGLLWRMIRHDWGLAGTIRVFYRLGRYIRQNSWQLFFFIDVCLRPLLGPGRSPCLRFHDQRIAPCIPLRGVDALTGVLCFIWFMGILAPLFWLADAAEQIVRHGKSRDEKIK